MQDIEEKDWLDWILSMKFKVYFMISLILCEGELIASQPIIFNVIWEKIVKIYEWEAHISEE